MLMGGGEAFETARPLRRPCPHDFGLVFVQIGRLACEEHYHAERDTITRWLNESGKDELTDKRKAFVKWRYRLLRGDSSIRRRQKGNWHPVPHGVVADAVRFLRAEPDRGAVIVPAGEGQWRVGTSIINQVELVAFAASLGFDPVSTLSPAHVLRQIWARP